MCLFATRSQNSALKFPELLSKLCFTYQLITHTKTSNDLAKFCFSYLAYEWQTQQQAVSKSSFSIVFSLRPPRLPVRCVCESLSSSDTYSTLFPVKTIRGYFRLSFFIFFHFFRTRQTLGKFQSCDKMLNHALCRIYLLYGDVSYIYSTKTIHSSWHRHLLRIR